MNPIPRVSPQKYAKVRFRIKGEKEGPVYQGQALVKPCVGCAKKISPET